MKTFHKIRWIYVERLKVNTSKCGASLHMRRKYIECMVVVTLRFFGGAFFNLGKFWYFMSENVLHDAHFNLNFYFIAKISNR